MTRLLLLVVMLATIGCAPRLVTNEDLDGPMCYIEADGLVKMVPCRELREVLKKYYD